MRSYTYATITAICFGFIGIFVKMVGDGVNPLTMSFFRIFFGFMFLLIVVPVIDKNFLKVSKKDLREFFIIGVGLAISMTLYVSANVFTTIQNAALIDYAYPFFVLIFAYFFLREKVTRTKLMTLGLAIVGLAVINPFNPGEGQFGNMLALGGAIVYGAVVTLMRKEDETHGIGDVFWFFLFATIFMLPIPFVYGVEGIVENMGLLVALGLLSTGIAYLFYNLAMEELEAETASMVIMVFGPLVSIAGAVWIIGEKLTTSTVVGGTLLLGAGMYLELHRKQLKREAK